jgi:hypothetical protein
MKADQSMKAEYCILYEHVQFKYLTSNAIDIFMSSFSPEAMNGKIWESLRLRLKLGLCKWDLPETRFGTRNFFFVQGGHLTGIINHLTKECGGNVHEKGIVNITVSSYLQGSSDCGTVVDYGSKSYWISDNHPLSWICFEFKGKSISLRNYTLKAGAFGWNWVVKWEVQGSNNATDWEILDRRETRDLTGFFNVGTYECSEANPKKFFRFIRIIQTAPNAGKSHSFQFTAVEFFGRVSS